VRPTDRRGRSRAPDHQHGRDDDAVSPDLDSIRPRRLRVSRLGKVLVVSARYGEHGLRKMFRAESTVDYYDREPTDE
jgi:hypothetical protein